MLEGARSKDIPKFFDLLTSHQVTHLVRLTDSYERETKKCHPYWDGLLDESHLNIPTANGVYPIRAFGQITSSRNSGKIFAGKTAFKTHLSFQS